MNLLHDTALFQNFVLAWCGLGIVVFLLLFRITAPYGRHTELRSWTISNRIGWVLMELPSPILFTIFFMNGTQHKTAFAWLFLTLWLSHYTYRSLVFPLRQKTATKRIPLFIVGSAVAFNCINGTINGHYLGHFAPLYPEQWLFDSRFVMGFLLFFAGFLLNFTADNVLLRLRKPGDTGYRIPYGPLFRYVSCPNYLGEIIEWGGFALLTWSPAALSFFIWTAANLIPRAIAHHNWYRSKFPQYPEARRAIIPFVL